MSFVDSVKQGFEIVKLNERVMTSVARDENATKMGLLFLALAGVASAIGTLSFLLVLPLILYPVFIIIIFAIMVGVYHVIAKLFGGQGNYSSLFRVISIGSILSWIAVIPFLGAILGILAGFWSVVVWVVSIRTVHKLSTGKAVLVVFIPLIIIFALWLFVLASVFAALLGGLGSSFVNR